MLSNKKKTHYTLKMKAVKKVLDIFRKLYFLGKQLLNSIRKLYIRQYLQMSFQITHKKFCCLRFWLPVCHICHKSMYKHRSAHTISYICYGSAAVHELYKLFLFIPQKCRQIFFLLIHFIIFSKYFRVRAASFHRIIFILKLTNESPPIN